MNLTPHYIIISKIINRISFKINWFYRVLPVKWIIRKKAGRFIKETNKACLQRNLKRILGSFQEFPETLKKSEDAKIIFDWADKTLRHEFDYLGSGLIKLDPIDWHIDFKSGFRWSKDRFYKKYVTVDLTNNADVKVPWELSRCHHLLWLGEAYLITKDEKYAREVIDQIEWWIEENPLMYSINWTCAMDVAIRVVNWMYAINMIIASVHVTDVFSKKLSGSLFEHGFFIYNNLEKWYPYSANHYAANITGLLFLGQMFHTTKQGKKWWNHALKEYFLEVRLQVLPSGVHFERSISYHRLMTELFAYPYVMLKRIKESIPLDIHIRLESMFGFVDNYTKPNGLSPLIGDNDDGRFLPFVKRDFRDHRYLLNIAGSLFGKNYANQEAKTLLADNYFLLNQTKRNDYNAQAEQLVVRDHRDAGFVILRKNKLFLFFTNSSLSGYPDLRRKMHGTHTHADYLSFELSIGEDDFIIDPGSYVYTASAKIRNEFRSTKMHNTVTIDNLNQIGISESKLFLVRGFNEPDLIDLHETNTEIEISGTKQWNIEGENTVLHSRKLNFYDNSKLILSDAICCNNRHSLNWYFHLAFDVEAVLCNKTIKMVNCNGSSLNMSFNTSNDFSINIIDSEYSPSYGVLIPTKVIQINIVADNNFILKTIIDY